MKRVKLLGCMGEYFLFVYCFLQYDFLPTALGFTLPVEPTLSIKVILNISAGITVTVAFVFHLPAVCLAPDSFAARTLACIEETQATTQSQHIPMMLLETIPCYCQFVSCCICEEYSSWPHAHEHKSAKTPPPHLIISCSVLLFTDFHIYPHPV